MTLPIRLERMPPSVEQHLDGAAEAGEISSGVHIALALYGDNATMTAIVSHPGKTESEIRLTQMIRSGLDPRDALADALIERARVINAEKKKSRKERDRDLDYWTEKRLSRNYELEVYGHQLIRQTAPARAKQLAVSSALSMLQQRASNRDWLSSWRFEDLLTGGCEKEFKKVTAVDIRGRILPEMDCRIRKRSRIRHYVEQRPELKHLHKMFVLLQETISTMEGPIAHSEEEYDAVHADFEEQMSAFRQEREAENAAWMETYRDGFDAANEIHDRVLVRLKPGYHAKQKKARKERHRMLKRSFKTASSLVGESVVRNFLQGEKVIVPGQDLDYALLRTAKPSRLGHGGVDVGVLDKETGAKLAGVCVYHENMPVLDQLAAFKMRIEAGDEQDILDAGNLYAIHPDAMKHPAIAAKSKKVVEHELVVDARIAQEIAFEALGERHERRMVRRRRGDVGRETMSLMIAKHQEECGHLYMEAIDRVIFAGLNIPPGLVDSIRGRAYA